jgi:GMP synthase-like glutamine amidotransferase
MLKYIINQMRVACVQHVSFEGPGDIAQWTIERGHSLTLIPLYAGQALPRTDELDLLVVMGGPMSVHDEASYPWLGAEKKLIAQCLLDKKFVLGVCLGSQLLAEALGSCVYRNPVKEIGWFPIRMRPKARQSPIFAGMPGQMDVLHWHGETYDLPQGCVHLAESDGCLVQAFEHPLALGLQFHLEATQEGLAELIRNCGQEIGVGTYEQDSNAIAAAERVHRPATQSALFGILDRIEAGIAAR